MFLNDRWDSYIYVSSQLERSTGYVVKHSECYRELFCDVTDI